MNFEEKYEIIKNNDETYDSIFYYAVKTTGIYCKPSCKSKLPRKENIEFYDNVNEILKKGYRPCKRCRSDLQEYKPNKEIANKLKNKIDKIFQEKELLGEEINKLGLSKKRVVEIFKEEYKITPSQYLNNLRLNHTKKLLTETNKNITDIAYTAGFKSISTFYKIFKDQTNTTPIIYRKISKENQNERICNI